MGRPKLANALSALDRKRRSRARRRLEEAVIEFYRLGGNVQREVSDSLQALESVSAFIRDRDRSHENAKEAA